MNMKYLVTGGAGFIGSNLARKLLANNEEVVILDNFATGRKSNLEDIKDQLTVIEGDIRSTEDVAQAIAGVDYVLHQAALPSVPRSVEDPISSNDVNINGTLNLLWAAKNEKVKKFVMASSSSVLVILLIVPGSALLIPLIILFQRSSI